MREAAKSGRTVGSLYGRGGVGPLPGGDVHSHLARLAPRDRGVNAGKVSAFLAEAEQLGVELNSIMLWRGDAVVAEGWWWPYRSDLRHMMHSATKSFLSVAIGLAIDEGLIALSDRVLSFFPEHAPVNPSNNLATMTIADLVTQTSGHAHGTSGSKWRSIPTSWIAEFLKIEVPYAPGEKFRYSSATSFMLSAIITKVTGDNINAYLTPRLFKPLGIEDLTWDIGPENINPGGNGISARTEDLLKLAILHLRGGVWNGRRILSADWVRAATAPARGNPYGHHWWTGPGGSFYAYGVFGQFAVVFPDHDAILAMTAATPYGEETLRSLIWHHFPDVFEVPLSQDPVAADDALADLLSAARVLPPLLPSRSRREAEVSGVTYFAEANADNVEWLKLRFEEDRCIFISKDEKGEHEVIAGLSTWHESSTSISGAPLHHGYEPATLRVVAGGKWLDDNCFQMVWQFNETAFRDVVTLRFDEKCGVIMDRDVNTNSMSPVRPTIFAWAK